MEELLFDSKSFAVVLNSKIVSITGYDNNFFSPGHHMVDCTYVTSMSLATNFKAD